MHVFKPMVFLLSAFCTAGGIIGSTARAQTAPATEPAATVPATTPAVAAPARPFADFLPANRVPFDFIDVPITDIIQYIAKSYDLGVIDPFKLGNRITITVPGPIGAREAIALLDQTLTPLGYTVIAEVFGEPGRVELRIAALSRQTDVPVFTGGDPAKITGGDQLRTQVLPINDLDPDKVKEMIADALGDKAEIVINPSMKTIIVTDTAAHIRAAAALIRVLEKQAAQTSPAPGK